MDIEQQQFELDLNKGEFVRLDTPHALSLLGEDQYFR